MMHTRPNQETLAVLEQLVSFDTTSHRSNLEAIAYIKERLESLGAHTRLTFDDDRRKANLYGIIGNPELPGIMLSGHTDVVPTEGQDWSHDPFQLTEQDGKVFGRGTSDMKGFIALAIAMAPEFVSRGLRTPLSFSFSYDEEVGCMGVRRLLAELAPLPVKPSLCIVGEPTMMQVIGGHKGKRSLRCHVKGRECHSALNDRGVNAIEAAAEVIAQIRKMQRRIRQDGPFDVAYDPPYSTLHTGVIQGGKALNIVPRDCWFDFEIRSLPHQGADSLHTEILDFAERYVAADMKRVDPNTGFVFQTINDTTGFDLPNDHPAIRFVSALVNNDQIGRVSFGTEAGLFNQIGIPTVVCGPGSIEQAHKPDEFITLDQLAQGEAALRRLMNHMCLA